MKDPDPGPGSGLARATRDGGPGARIAWAPTLAAKCQARLHIDHLRYARRRAGTGALHCFVLDCSASMLARGQLALAKGVLVALFDRARHARFQVALISFGGAGAELRFGPAVPRWWNERWLAPIGGGGGTPLAAGIAAAARVLESAARRDPGRSRHLWLMSDGRSTQWLARPRHADRVTVVDFEAAAVRLGRCAVLAEAWDAQCIDARTLLAEATAEAKADATPASAD
ncbi:VWA domain-containing protein [Paraburkholderia sp. B3]|uniref:vWA domain-containing protein n=1 Tax=Paraburkholderia sp. B3 TaxID=3134791 RepID=UPI0039823B89